MVAGFRPSAHSAPTVGPTKFLCPPLPRRYFPRVDHSPGFLKLVNDARANVRELTVEQLRARLTANPRALLLDVREDSEWQAGHAEQAQHLGKGILERDLELRFPDPDAEIILYCGGGFRSALSCDAAQRMGYRNVASLVGGYKGLVAANWPMKKAA